MNVVPIKTRIITDKDRNIFKILDESLPTLKEKSIVVITSKIISICEGTIVKESESTREELAMQEADLYLPASESKYDFSITVKNGIFIASGGVDESNGNGYFILWPKDPQKSANEIRSYLLKKFKLKHVGVIITDSKTTPLRWGVTGVALSHSGFASHNSYIGKKDIFGRKFHASKANIMDGLAASAVVVMGEGNEKMPIALIEDVPFVSFQSRNPTTEELELLNITIDEDMYAPILKNVRWKKKK